MKGGNKEKASIQYIHAYCLKHRQLQIFFLELNKLVSTTINAPSIATFKDRLKAMPPTRAWMHLCISYVSIYIPDLSYKSQGGSAD